MSSTKITIIKSVTAVICAVSVCFSISSAVGKYSDAMIKSAEASGSVEASEDVTAGSELDGNYTAEDTDTQATENEYIIATDTTSASTQADKSDKSSTASNGKKSSDPTEYSAAQIVSYYNDCLNKTYKLSKLKIEKTETIDIVIDDVTPGGDLVVALGNRIVKKYANAQEYTDTFANGKSTTGGCDAQEFAMHSSLDAKGAKSASIKKSGNGYEINITVVSENATLTKKPIYNAQCSNPLDIASVDLLGIEVTKADFSYTGTTLKAIVDANGRVKTATCYMPLAGTGAGQKIGIKGSATVHGSMIKSATFTF